MSWLQRRRHRRMTERLDHLGIALAPWQRQLLEDQLTRSAHRRPGFWQRVEQLYWRSLDRHRRHW